MTASTRSSRVWQLLGAAALVALTLGLAACGGGTTPAAEASGAASAQPRATTTPAIEPDAALAQGARLNAASLVAAEKAAAGATDNPTDALQPGQTAPKSAYRSGEIARKAAAVKVAVYRFFNSRTGAHFFTRSTTERDNVVATQSPPFSLEGEAFSVASDFSPGLSPVHRFYNTQNGVHLYTISEAERANVAAKLPQFHYEGVAYHASEVAGMGFKPFYRFYVPSKGFHFYTANEAEKDNIVAKLSTTYTFEGVGYYVLDSDWRAEKLPHTGVGDAGCYGRLPDNTPYVGDCSDNTVFGNQQDGHRSNINPMSYSAVDGYTTIDCVKDKVTGLIWEGKEASGTRAGGNTYTNRGNGAANDASGYVAAVNNAKLCGFNDWRLPTGFELQTLVDYGKPASGGPSLNTSWFVNSAAMEGVWAERIGVDKASYVEFAPGDGDVWSADQTELHQVRLVRGSMFNGPRFSYSSVAYPGDSANNVVNDALSGLQWRRCVQGMGWNGTTCTGTPTTFTHENAVRYASPSGWRLPNVKELSSLVDRNTSNNPRIDATAFPATPDEFQWTSTPYVDNPMNRAWFVTPSGLVLGDSGFSRGYMFAVRLVRQGQ